MICEHSGTRALVMLGKKVWGSDGVQIRAKRCSLGLKSGIFAGQSSSSTSTLANSKLSLCMGGASSGWNRSWD